MIIFGLLKVALIWIKRSLRVHALRTERDAFDKATLALGSLVREP